MTKTYKFKITVHLSGSGETLQECKQNAIDNFYEDFGEFEIYTTDLDDGVLIDEDND